MNRIFICLLLLSSCKTPKVQNAVKSTIVSTTIDTTTVDPLNLANNGDLIVQLTRGACYGTCPAYNINFYSNGLLLYNGQRNTPKVGCFYTKISASELKWLVNAITSLGFLKLQDKYPTNSPAPVDLPNTAVYLRSGTQEKTVRERKWETPVNLISIESTIDSFANAKILQSCDK